MFRASRVPLLTTALLSLAFASHHTAQEREQEDPDRPSFDEPDYRKPSYLDDPTNAFDLALGGKGLWFGYRNGQHRGRGYVELQFFADQESDYALLGRLMRFGEPSVESPLGFGVGLGLFGATVDETDSDVVAITVTGAVDFALDDYFVLDYPARIGVEASYAPDVATFSDGRRVLDLLARVEVDLSAWATVFAGFRHLEVDIDQKDDAELDSALQAGVRLGF